MNGVQQGPYSKEQVAAMRLPAATPVWYEGLAQWVPACQAPELADLYGGAPAEEATPQEGEETIVATEVVEEPQPDYARACGTTRTYAAEAADMPKCPPTFLAWSIILTLCCCTPFSIAAIVCGALTNSRYNSGNYDGARRMSHATEWLVIISITLGIVGLPLSMLMMF